MVFLKRNAHIIRVIQLLNKDFFIKYTDSYHNRIKIFEKKFIYTFFNLKLNILIRIDQFNNLVSLT